MGQKLSFVPFFHRIPGLIPPNPRLQLDLDSGGEPASLPCWSGQANSFYTFSGKDALYWPSGEGYTFRAIDGLFLFCDKIDITELPI